MKKKFYLILVTLILIFPACEDNQQKHEAIAKKVQISQEQTPKVSSKETINEVLTQQSVPKAIVSQEYHYKFTNLKEQVSTLDIKNDIYDFKNIKQSIVILNVMSTWCPPCRGQLPHLSKLQQKFKENVFVMSMLVHDDILKEKLEKFIIAEKVLFYVSVSQKQNLHFIDMLTPKLGLAKDFPLPLTIVFVRGKYFTHYEGMIPEEMIESDINQLLEKIKK